MLTRWLKDAKNAKKLNYLRGINQFPHDYQMNISHSASRITLSYRGMQVKTELRCGIFIFVCKISHD